MKKTLLSVAIATMFAASTAWGCPQGNCDPSAGSVSIEINAVGGGEAFAIQNGAGTSAAEFSTTAGGTVSSDTNLITRTGRRGASVSTDASLTGDVYSTTTGTATGNAGGYNYSGIGVDGAASIDGSISLDRNLGELELGAGSNVLGGANAESAVSLGPNDPGVTTDGYSYQEAGFDAYNASSAKARVRIGDEYCEVPTTAVMRLETGGDTATYARGTLTGEGATGQSASYAGQGGYAEGDLDFEYRDTEINMDGYVGNNFSLNDTEVQSYSVSTNSVRGNGIYDHSASSESDAYVNQRADVYAGRCCDPTTTVEVTDGKSVTGTVSGGHPDRNQAGGGVEVDFNTSVNVSTTGNDGDDDEGEGENNGWGNGDQDPPGNSGDNNNAENGPNGRP